MLFGSRETFKIVIQNRYENIWFLEQKPLWVSEKRSNKLVKHDVSER